MLFKNNEYNVKSIISPKNYHSIEIEIIYTGLNEMNLRNLFLIKEEVTFNFNGYKKELKQSLDALGITNYYYEDEQNPNAVTKIEDSFGNVTNINYHDQHIKNIQRNNIRVSYEYDQYENVIDVENRDVTSNRWFKHSTTYIHNGLYIE